MSYNYPPPSKGIEEDEDVEAGDNSSSRSASRSRRLHSSHRSSMSSSVLRFKDVNFLVGKKDNTKRILEDVSGKVKWGRKSLGGLLDV
jgi:hypothetical protein